ncbi:MAG: hypothetical protein OEX11_08220 [Nitrosomonas sp.]|nr:hypothetical protein [Nitrosomonas sp.]
MNDPESKPKTKEGNKKDLSFDLMMPAALLLVLLMVPFSINTMMHYVSKSKQFHPLIMKIPIDSSGIIIPSEVKQYEGFKVSLNLKTQQLADFINEMVSIASEGTAIQSITGEVSPNMRAEIVGEDFLIDNPGPQDQLYGYDGLTEWSWHVIPESSGKQVLNFRLHLLTHDNGQQNIKVVDLAEASFLVESSPLEWLARNWLWIILVALIPLTLLKILRRRYRTQNP